MFDDLNPQQSKSTA